MNSFELFHVPLPFFSVNDCYEFNTDYASLLFEQDVNNCAIKTESAQECQATCQNQEGCLEFTWIGVDAYADEYPNMDNKHKCCHKGRLHTDDSHQITGEKKRHVPGLISGPKFCDGASGK